MGKRLNNLDWQNIFVPSLKSLEYKKNCEFKFKILHNILPSGKLVSKWSPSQQYHCLEPETVLHMLYTCSRVKTIWLKVGEILQLEIKCKHVILGLYSTNTINNVRNMIIVIFMYSIYCAWVKCNVELHFNYVFKGNHRRKIMQKNKESICIL